MDRPLIWSNSFDVGHEGLDKEHRRLVGLINDLCMAVERRDAKETASRLRALAAEAKAHITHETHVLDAFRRDLEDRSSRHMPKHLKTAMVAAIEDHIADHVTLRDRLAEVTRTVRNGNWAEGTSICQIVELWFLDHAVKYDIQLKTIMQSMQRPLHDQASSR